MYSKVASRSTFWLVAHPSIFRMFMKGKFDAYLLWPFTKSFQNWIVYLSTALLATLRYPSFKILLSWLTPFYAQDEKKDTFKIESSLNSNRQKQDAKVCRLLFTCARKCFMRFPFYQLHFSQHLQPRSHHPRHHCKKIEMFKKIRQTMTS